MSAEIPHKSSLRIYPDEIIALIAGFVGLRGLLQLWCCGDLVLHHKLGAHSGTYIIHYVNPLGAQVPRLPSFISQLNGLKEIRLQIRSSGRVPHLTPMWTKQLPSSIQRVYFECRESGSCWDSDPKPSHITRLKHTPVNMASVFPNLQTFVQKGCLEPGTGKDFVVNPIQSFYSFPSTLRVLDLSLPNFFIQGLPKTLEVLSLSLTKLPKLLKKEISSLDQLHTLSLNKLRKYPKTIGLFPASLCQLELAHIEQEYDKPFDPPLPPCLLSLKMCSIACELIGQLPVSITSLSGVELSVESFKLLPSGLSSLHIISTQNNPVGRVKHLFMDLKLTHLKVSNGNNLMKTDFLKYLPPSVTSLKITDLDYQERNATFFTHVPSTLREMEIGFTTILDDVHVPFPANLASLPVGLQRLVFGTVVSVRTGPDGTWENVLMAISQNRPELLEKLIVSGVVGQQQLLAAKSVEKYGADSAETIYRCYLPIGLAIILSNPGLACLRRLINSDYAYISHGFDLHYLAKKYHRWEALQYLTTIFPDTPLFATSYRTTSSKNTPTVPSSLSMKLFCESCHQGLIYEIISDGSLDALKWIHNDFKFDLNYEEVPKAGNAMTIALSMSKLDIVAWLFTNVDDYIDSAQFAEAIIGSKSDPIQVLEKFQGRGKNGRKVMELIGPEFIAEMLYSPKPLQILSWAKNNGYNLSLRENDGSTLAHRILRVKESDFIEVAEWLFEHGSPFDSPNRRDTYPVHIWVEKKRLDVLKWAFEKKIPFRPTKLNLKLSELAKQFKATQEMILWLESCEKQASFTNLV